MGEDSDIQKMAEDLLVRHEVPEALIDQKSEIIRSIEQITKDEKVRTAFHTIRVGTNNATVFYIWRSDAVIGRSYQ